MSKASERRIILGVDDSPSGRAALTSIATRDGDMIVVGRNHAPGWWHGHRGSVSRYCRSHAGCPVVVVPTDQESL